MHKQDQINLLLAKLESLLKRQESFSKETEALREELMQLKATTSTKVEENPETYIEVGVEQENSNEEVIREEAIKVHQAHTQRSIHKKLIRDVQNGVIGGVCAGVANYLGTYRFLIRLIWSIASLFFGVGLLLYIVLWIAMPKAKREKNSLAATQIPEKKQTKHKTNIPDQLPKLDIKLEKFIGENILSKIGIVILIIGVAIGTKYSIEHDLISPLTRVILGYLVGLGLLGLGIKLKKAYKNFSAVLVSGSMTILYFMTYAAYSFYQLFPQILAFTLMVVFTVFAVIAALNYKNQIIAHIGLVGAYAVPFLLSENSENISVLFSYMTIINIGILMIALKKYWKQLYFSSFSISWLIFISWYVSNFNVEEHFGTALIFSLVFFVIFYITFIAFKLLKSEKFVLVDILLLLANSFIFYGVGYSVLSSHEFGNEYLGVFTLCNAVLHFIVSVIIYRQKLADKNLFYLVSGLVLVFITMAIPVQLDGNWVTLLWVGEAALLFWIGRTKTNPVYEYISYSLMILAIFSICHDWLEGYNYPYFKNISTSITPLFNIHFLTSLLFVGSFGFIYWLDKNKQFKSPLKKQWVNIISFVIPAVIIGSLYTALRLELENYWYNLYSASELKLGEYEVIYNYDLLHFKVIWVLNYTMLFLSALTLINAYKLRDRSLGLINLCLNAIVIIVFLTHGLYVLSELRESYLLESMSEYYEISSFHIWIRYISFAFLAITLFASSKCIRSTFMDVDLSLVFDLAVQVSILWIASSELINLMDLSGYSETYKLGLSILWGVYSLLLISYGIWQNKKHFRIGAIALFSVTLIKLFFYDISHLNTISKTIVFVSLGILLLIISFLYNKFKHKITDDIED
jgi:uncharacterized membrane protein